MKKPILLVLSALLLALLSVAAVFFIPSILDPVIEYETRVTIDAPRPEVWETFNDDEKTKQWIEGLTIFEHVSGEPRKPGSKYRLVVDTESEKIEMYETVTEVKEGELYAFTLDAEPLTNDVRVSFEDRGGKTEVIQQDSVKGKNLFWRALFYWLQSTFKDGSRDHLERFKKLVEAEQKGR